MMRHVSVFRLKPEFRTAEMMFHLKSLLAILPEKVSTITGCEIGVRPVLSPEESPDGKVQFYDLIQILTFENETDCLAYPTSQGHQDFLHASTQYISDVTAIDYIV